MSTQSTTASLGAIDGVDVVGATGDAQTEDQVLGITPETEAPVETPPETPAEPAETPAGEAEPKPATGEPKPGESAPAAAPTAIPKELTALLKDPAIGPKLKAVMPAIQSAFDNLTNYREATGNAPLAAVREMFETFPGGLEEARAIRENAQILEEADEQFTGGPAEQAALAQEWAEEFPEAFQSMVVQAANVLQARNPQAFEAITAKVFTDRLTSAGWDEQFEAMREAIGRKDTDRLMGLASWLIQDADKRGIAWNPRVGRVNPEREALDRDRAAVNSEREAATQERVQTFNEAVNTSVETSVRGSIKATLGQLLKDTAFSEKGKERIQQDVYQELDRRVKADKSIARQFKQIVRQNGRLNLSPAAKQQVADLLTGKARAILTKVARDIIAQRTEEIVAQSKATTDKKIAAGQRTDVTGGASPVVRTKKITPKDVEGMTDDEIMNL